MNSVACVFTESNDWGTVAQAKSTIVRFYEARCLDDNEQEVHLEDDFWTTLIDKVSNYEENDRTVLRNTRELIGVSGHHVKTGKKYLYLGKPRHRADYPDDLADGATAPSSLADNASIFRMSEWTYIVPTEFGLSIAVVRSSGGASPEEIAAWVNEVAGFDQLNNSFRLSAILDENQMETLEQSDLVGSLDVVLTGEQAAGLDGELGAIGSAAAEAANVSGDAATIEIRWSYGRKIPDTIDGRGFADKAKIFLRGKKYKKAVASLKTERPDGSWRTDVVNFVTEIVTYRVTLSDSLSEAMALDKLMPQIVGAIMENRKHLLR